MKAHAVLKAHGAVASPSTMARDGFVEKEPQDEFPKFVEGIGERSDRWNLFGPAVVRRIRRVRKCLNGAKHMVAIPVVQEE